MHPFPIPSSAITPTGGKHHRGFGHGLRDRRHALHRDALVATFAGRQTELALSLSAEVIVSLF